MVKKEILVALMIISMFIVSACDVYNTLYVKEPAAEGESVEVPEGDIITEAGPDAGEKEGAAVEEIGIEIGEEEAEKEIPEDATVITVQETDLVSLVPKAEDPDKDILTFTFTSPLNENGEWKTIYGDAGEYTITVTASDSKSTTSKDVLIIVNRKEEAPVLDSFKPEDTAMEIKETNAVAFDVVASDLNKDELAYAWKLDGVTIGDKNSIEYKTTYEDSGSHTIKVTVSDGMFDTEKIWSVTVDNLNRKPILKNIDNVKVKETETVVIELEASDSDGDTLTYSVDDERFVQDENKFTWETTYDAAGEHIITAAVSDGVDTTSQEFTVTIENVNRAPVILDIVQKQ